MLILSFEKKSRWSFGGFGGLSVVFFDLNPLIYILYHQYHQYHRILLRVGEMIMKKTRARVRSAGGFGGIGGK